MRDDTVRVLLKVAKRKDEMIGWAKDHDPHCVWTQHAGYKNVFYVEFEEVEVISAFVIKFSDCATIQ